MTDDYQIRIKLKRKFKIDPRYNLWCDSSQIGIFGFSDHEVFFNI